MDTARCLCPQDATGAKVGTNYGCPIHGYNGRVPLVPYDLSFGDKQMLRTMRIDPEDGPEIQQTRQSDEDRWKRE